MDLDLTDVKSHSEFESDTGDLVAQPNRRTHRVRWDVPHGEHAVTGGLHDAPTGLGDDTAGDPIVASEEFGPTAVARFTAECSGIDDVGEQDRREPALRSRLRDLAGERGDDTIVELPPVRHAP